MKNFFDRIRATFYDPAFYIKARTEDLSPSIRLTALLALVGASITAVVLYTFIVPFAFLPVIDTVESVYPDDLIITVEGGEMSINQEQPYYIKNTLFKDGPENLVIFDGEDALEGTATQNSTFALVKKTYVVAGNEDDERIENFGQIGSTTISKSDVSAFASAVRPYYKPVLLGGGFVFAAFGAVFVTIFWLIFHLLYLMLLPAPALYLYGRFRTPKFAFKESYIVAVYASIPVAILTFVILLLGFDVPPFVYTLLVILVAIVNLSQKREEAPMEDS